MTEDWEFQEATRLRELLREREEALETERGRLRSLVEVLGMMEIDVAWPDGVLMVTDSRLESALQLEASSERA